MERSASIYGSSNVLCGVQLKIGEKFKPPSKVTLPVGWKTRDTSRLLNLCYDFALEEDVIAKVTAEREAREQQEQAQKIKEFDRTSTANPAVATMGCEILQPTTATMTNSTNSNNDNKQFNYKDFEDNADTPFETVELQSINNMDALKSILQPDMETNSGACLSSNDNQSQDEGNAHEISIPGSSHQCHPQSLESSFPINGSPVQVNEYPDMYPGDPMHTQPGQTIAQTSNPFTAKNSLISDSGGQGQVSSDIVSVSPQGNIATYSTGSMTSNTDRKILLPGAMKVLPVAPARPPPRRPASVPNESLNSEIMSGYRIHGEAPSTSPGQKRPIPKPRSKLSQMLNEPGEGHHVLPPQIPPHIPPPIPPPIPPKKNRGKNRNIEQTKTPDVSMDHPNLKRYPSPLPPISPLPSPPKPHNDPRSAMTPEEIQFVDQISAIGFPLERVARAVKNLGCKEREVVEFLISVNDMCSLGYSEGQVEMVLKENSDQKKAVEFLKLIVQFKELGFQEEKIFEALKTSECDSNKTLDILTCAG